MDNWLLLDGRQTFGRLELPPLRATKPKIRYDLEGAAGLWETMLYLCVAAKEHVAASYPLAVDCFWTAAAVAEHVMLSVAGSSNLTFQRLYSQYAQCHLALHMANMSTLATAEVVSEAPLWNYTRATLHTNVVASMYLRQLEVYVRESQFCF